MWSVTEERPSLGDRPHEVPQDRAMRTIPIIRLIILVTMTIIVVRGGGGGVVVVVAAAVAVAMIIAILVRPLFRSDLSV